MIVNLWGKQVSDRTVSLLNRWIERRMSNGLRSAFLPQPETRLVLHKRYDKHGVVRYDEEVREGMCVEKSTAPKPWTDADECGMTFLKLPQIDRMVIEAAADPLNKYMHSRDWKRFLRNSRIHKQRIFDEMLTRAMVRLQQALERKGLVKKMTGQIELHGWKEIAKCLKVSVSTAITLAKEHGAPVTLLGGTPYTTAERLTEWKQSLFNKKPFREKKE